MVDSEKFLDIWPIIKPRFVKAGRVSFFFVAVVVMVVVYMERLSYPWKFCCAENTGKSS